MSEPVINQPPLTPSENVVTISTQLLVAAVIFLFMVIVFIFFLYLYAKNYLRSNPSLRRSRTHLIFTAAAEQTPPARRGLEAQLLKSLPVTIFNPSDFKDGLECAVCLSEISRGEEIRLLPKCSHGFHVACIDMWFHSHTTCPLCRSPVTGEAEAVEEVQPQELIFPTNVLFWGNQELVSNGVQSQVASPEEGTSSSSSLKRPEGSLVIDIPRRAMDELVSPMASLSPMEEMKTPKSARLRSLRRLLSRGKMVIGASCSPKGSDIEQGAVVGEGSSLAPKTPTRK